MKSGDTYYYKCDGGENPGHHQPRSVEVYQEGGVFQVELNGNKYNSKEEAEDELMEKYDSVILRSVKTCYYQKMNTIIKQ